MDESIRVLIADDQTLLRGSFRVLVDASDGMETVGEVSTGAEAVESAKRLNPDVVLMDVRMPELDGIVATEQICDDPATAGVRVLVLTMFDIDDYVYSALRAGASGFLLKDASPGDLVAGIRTVAAGESVLAPTATRRVVSHFACTGASARPRPEPRVVGLTEREQDVLVLVAQGKSNAELAAELSVSLPTVKSHVRNLLAKLQARDRVQLVILAYDAGLVGRDVER